MNTSKTQRTAWADALVHPSTTNDFATPSRAIKHVLTTPVRAKLHHPKDTRLPQTPRDLGSTVIKITQESVVTCALRAHNEGTIQGVLIFCSATRPGGGWLFGAVAQEEAVSYCSTWGMHCYHEKFHKKHRPAPFYGSDLITLKGHLVASELGQWLDTPVPCFFAGFAAPNMKAAKEKNISTTSRETTQHVLHDLTHGFLNTLEAFYAAGVNHALLGPIGCGVFENDPVLCAKAAMTALTARDWGFKTIEFALGQTPSEAIVRAFENAFKAELLLDV